MAGEWSTVEYTAPNTKVGFSSHQIQDLLQRHSPLCIVKAQVGWRGQIQKLILSTPSDDPLAGKSFDVDDKFPEIGL